MNIDEISINAARYTLPFKKEDKGFKDELIVLSIFEYAHKLKSKNAMLISNDDVFFKQALKTRFDNKEINLISVRSLEEANEWFDNMFMKL